MMTSIERLKRKAWLIKRIELFILKLMLRLRERRIGKDFDRQLSLEIDCLHTLIEGKK